MRPRMNPGTLVRVRSSPIDDDLIELWNNDEVSDASINGFVEVDDLGIVLARTMKSEFVLVLLDGPKLGYLFCDNLTKVT